LLYYKKYLTYQTSSALMGTTQEAFMTDPLNAQMAREDLQYIRQTLQAAGQFTAVPGKSLMLAGVMALAGVACNLLLTGAPWSRGASPVLALDSWGLVLGISVAIVCYGIYRKSQQLGLLSERLWRASCCGASARLSSWE